jgi:uncharacterized membrane protein
MNVNFESSKTLAIEGSILLLLSLIPYIGWVLGIVGIVLLMKSMKEFSSYYNDPTIYQDSLTGVKYYVIAIVAAAISIAAITLGVWSATHFTSIFTLTAGFGIGAIAFFAGLIVAFVFYVLAATHLKRTFNTLAQKSGETSFATAGTLLLLGAILTIVLVGLILIFIAWIFVAIGFFTIKPAQYQQYVPQPNGYGYNPSPPQPEQTKTLQQTKNS